MKTSGLMPEPQLRLPLYWRLAKLCRLLARGDHLARLDDLLAHPAGWRVLIRALVPIQAGFRLRRRSPALAFRIVQVVTGGRLAQSPISFLLGPVWRPSGSAAEARALSLL